MSGIDVLELNQRPAEFRRLLDVLNRLPPVRPKIFASVAEANSTRCMCGNVRARSEMRMAWSGVVNFHTKWCHGCKNVDQASWCPIVCVTCKEPIAYKEPGVKDPVDGFVFERGRCYHVAKCAFCDLSLESVPIPIIERHLWQQHNQPIRTHITS